MSLTSHLKSNRDLTRRTKHQNQINIQQRTQRELNDKMQRYQSKVSSAKLQDQVNVENSLFTLISAIRLKRIDFTEKFIYSVIGTEKLFFFGYQYRKTFSVIYAETINRKTENH